MFWRIGSASRKRQRGAIYSGCGEMVDASFPSGLQNVGRNPTMPVKGVKHGRRRRKARADNLGSNPSIPIESYRKEMKMEKPTITCLCGSTKFRWAFEKANAEETIAGKIVLSVGFFMHSEAVEITKEQKEKLDELHKRKIDLADEVLILNINGYIGESTRSEIEYATKAGKRILYYEKGHPGQNQF